MKKTGAEILIEGLLQENVDVVFGFPGGVLLDIYDKLFDAPLRHILTRHEQAALHAADGYARATGKVGVCIATSGPGATNLVTGIATAAMDSVPIVAFTGQVPTRMIGGDAFQEADIVGITRPITKHSYLVKDVNDLARIIKEAFHIARTGRPGPVVVDIPKDVSISSCVFKWPETVNLRGYKPVLKGNQGQINKAVSAIEAAHRPVIYAGGGVIISDAHDELLKLAERYRIPVTTTLMGLGGFPGTHPLFLGMLGMHGTYAANNAINDSDLIIAIGARFDDRVTGKLDEFAPNSLVIHIDIDPSSISKNVAAHIPIVGDVKSVLTDLLEALGNSKVKPTPFREKWIEQTEEWKEDFPLGYLTEPAGVIKPQYVVERLYELTKGDAIITTEVGQNQMWAAQFYKFDKPRTFITSGGLGTMGYGFPAAIGAKIAMPDKVVIDIAGDGSIQMNIQELATAVQQRLPVIVAILNNGFLGMVRQWQELFYNRRYCNTCIEVAPDFVKVAEAYGAVGLRATTPEEVDNVIIQALAVKDKPVFIDFKVDREENVYPMVPAGKPLREMIIGPNATKERKKRIKAVE